MGRLDYYRGIGNYFRYLKARPEWRGKRVFVRFYGAGTVADLMVNGRHAGEHRGGNNAFEFEITDLLDYGGKNLLWVIVNNGARLSGTFTVTAALPDARSVSAHSVAKSTPQPP